MPVLTIANLLLPDFKMRNFILFCILLTCTYAQDFASLENNKTFYMKKAKENFGYLGNVKSPEGIDGQANIYIPQQFENIIARRYEYTLDSGKKCVMINVHHPSCYFSYSQWHEIIKQALC